MTSSLRSNTWRQCPVCGIRWFATKHNYRNATCSQSCGNAHGSGTPWTAAQLRTLKQLYAAFPYPARVPVREIAAIVGHTPSSVKYKAHQLGIAEPRRPRGESKYASGTRDDLGIFVRSSWEANYARYLEWLRGQGIIACWEYEPKTFTFGRVKRGNREYTPDFRVEYPDGRVEWHEVKGFLSDSGRVKLERFRRDYPDETLVIIDEDAYRGLVETVAPLISGWERPRRKDHL